MRQVLSSATGQAAGIAAWVCAVAVTLGACSQDGQERSQPSGTGTQPHLPPSLSQPFALLHVQQYDSISNALMTHAEQCAARKGFEVPHDWVDSANGFIVSLRDFGDLTEAELRAKGLHPGPPTTRSDAVRSSKAAEDVLAKCREDADRRLGPSYPETDARVTALMNEMTEPYFAAMASMLRESDRAEAECAVRHGWHPARPKDVGSEEVSIFEVFGIEPGRTVTSATHETQTYLPSPREVDLALELLRCSRTLGTPAKLLAAAKAAQLPIVARHEQQILQLNDDIDALARKAAAVLK